jgi:hypothetical protein
VLETQDSGLKIGTETVQDIHDILFERCTIVRSCRGLCIQLRDEGSVFNIVFRNIHFVAQHFSAPWWGRGEGISFTALPRTPETRLGSLHHISVEQVTGRAENSTRIEGSPQARAHHITLKDVSMTLGRWTRYPGGIYDNRPTSAVTALEPHDTPGFHIRHADQVTLANCRLKWRGPSPAEFSHAVEAVDVTGLKMTQFAGVAAHPDRQARTSVR